MKSLDDRLRETTRAAIVEALVATHGARAEAARELHVSQRTILRHLGDLFEASELEALAVKHGWPTRAELAARAADTRWHPETPKKAPRGPAKRTR